MDNEIQELIQAEKAKELANQFNKTVEQAKPTKPLTSELIEQSLGQAIVIKLQLMTRCRNDYLVLPTKLLTMQ